MQDDRKHQRIANKNFIATCRTKAACLPAPVYRTLSHILDKMWSYTDYTYSWPSQASIGEALGYKPNKNGDYLTIYYHIKALADSGLFIIEKFTARQARQMLKERFDYKPGRDELVYAHKLNFYSINRQHPFWQGEAAAKEQVLAAVTAVLAKRDGKRTRKQVEPLARDNREPLARDNREPLARQRANPLKQKETAKPVSNPTDPDEIRTLPEPEGADFISREPNPTPPPPAKQFSDYFDDQEIADIFSGVEIRMMTDGRVRHPANSLAPKGAAKKWTELLKEIKREREDGDYPSASHIVNVLNDEKFKGLRTLSWGLMVSTEMGIYGEYRRLTKDLLIAWMEASKVKDNLKPSTEINPLAPITHFEGGIL